MVYVLIGVIVYLLIFIIIWSKHLYDSKFKKEKWDWGNLFIFFQKMKESRWCCRQDERNLTLVGEKTNPGYGENSFFYLSFTEITPTKIHFYVENIQEKEYGMVFDPLRFFIVHYYLVFFILKKRHDYKKKQRIEKREVKRKKYVPNIWSIDKQAKRQLLAQGEQK
jgi:hypothetical protein